MTILLTGATGFVGRNLLLSLIQGGSYSKIYLPVRSLSKFKEQMKGEGYGELPEGVMAFETDASGWNLGEAAGAEHVVHAAGAIFAQTKAEYWNINVEGTLRLFAELKAPKKIIVLSSLAAAGPGAPGQPRKEDQQEAPVTWYGQSKLEMERRLAAEFGHMPYVCLRPPMIFGPRDHATLPLFKMMTKPVHFKPGFGAKYFSVLGVGDLCDGILAALSKPFPKNGRAYFIAHSEVITDWELLQNAARVCGRPSRILPVPQWVLKQVSKIVDSIPTWRTTIPTLSVDRAKEIWPNYWEVVSTDFERDFQWKAHTPFAQSLVQTRDWYLRTSQL